MPKESAPQGGGMNRREFLKKGAIAVGATRQVGKLVEAQEQTPPDNHLQAIAESAIQTKINFPDTFAPMTPEAKAIILAIQSFQLTFMPGEVDKSVFNGGSAGNVKLGEAKSIENSKVVIWNELQKAGLTSGKYSQDTFYQSILNRLPNYLARYGIFLYPQYINMDVNNKIIFSETLISFSKVGRVVREDATQLGTPVHRDLLYISDLSSNDGWLSTRRLSASAQAMFGNIEVSESDLRTQFEQETKALENFKNLVAQNSSQGLEVLEREKLAQDNWRAAADIAMARLLPKMGNHFEYQDFLRQTIEHETRHLIDFEHLKFRDFLPFQVEQNAAKSLKESNNLGVHKEINPIIVELALSRDKARTLLFVMNKARLSNLDVGHGIAAKWILRNMVEVICLDPDKYKIEIKKDVVMSPANQVFSQLYKLVDAPKAFEDLCKNLIDIHNKNLGENIFETDDYVTHAPTPVPKARADVSGMAYKVGIPAAVGGAAYALKKFIDRKKKVAKDNMTRQQKRAEGRKNGKK